MLEKVRNSERVGCYFEVYNYVPRILGICTFAAQSGNLSSFTLRAINYECNMLTFRLHMYMCIVHHFLQ